MQRNVNTITQIGPLLANKMRTLNPQEWLMATTKAKNYATLTVSLSSTGTKSFLTPIASQGPYQDMCLFANVLHTKRGEPYMSKGSQKEFGNLDSI